MNKERKDGAEPGKSVLDKDNDLAKKGKIDHSVNPPWPVRDDYLKELKMTQENDNSKQSDKNKVTSDDQKGGGMKQREYGESDVLKQTRGENFDTSRNRP